MFIGDIFCTELGLSSSFLASAWAEFERSEVVPAEPILAEFEFLAFLHTYMGV